MRGGPRSDVSMISREIINRRSQFRPRRLIETLQEVARAGRMRGQSIAVLCR
jgi:hypothetical protein